MPLVDVAVEKWRQWRENVARGEESRKQVFLQIHDEVRHKDCEKVAYLLWEADGKPEGNGERYYVEAQRRLKGVRWRLYQLHQPFISLEKKVIEPLDGWADRANIFQFFSKISPILEAFGVLAIPFVILAFEVRQERRQQQFEEKIISAQADVRQQQAVREYLSQVTTIYLESDQGKKLREDEELRKLLEANTLALFDELSLREDISIDSDWNREFEEHVYGIWSKDRKGLVVRFLSSLSWINALDNEESLVSLSQVDLTDASLGKTNFEQSNLVRAYLNRSFLAMANLKGADLREAHLEKTTLVGANLKEANLKEADLKEARLIAANLEKANLEKANFYSADLKGANFYGADLKGVNFYGADLKQAILYNVKNLSNAQIKLACNWDKAIYTESKWSLKETLSLSIKDPRANQEKIKSIRQDKASDPQEPPECG